VPALAETVGPPGRGGVDVAGIRWCELRQRACRPAVAIITGHTAALRTSTALAEKYVICERRQDCEAKKNREELFEQLQLNLQFCFM
jgi:hypothetical protein